MIASVYADEFDCFDKWRRALVVSVLDAIKCRRRPWFLGKNASAVFPHLKHLVIGLGLSVELTCFHTSAMSSSCKHARLKLNLLVLSFVISLVAIARENQFLCTVFVTTHTPYYAIKMCWDFVCWFHQGQHCHHTLSNQSSQILDVRNDFEDGCVCFLEDYLLSAFSTSMHWAPP